MGSTSVWHSVLNVKARAAAFYYEKALIGAFSMTVNLWIVCSSRYCARQLVTDTAEMRWCSDTVVVLGTVYLSAAHLIVAALLVNNFTSPVTTVTIALLHGRWSTGCQLDLTYTGVAHWHSQAESFLFPPQSWGFFRYLVNKISQFNIFPYSIFFETKLKCNVVNILQYSTYT